MAWRLGKYPCLQVARAMGKERTTAGHRINNNNNKY